MPGWVDVADVLPEAISAAIIVAAVVVVGFIFLVLWESRNDDL